MKNFLLLLFLSMSFSASAGFLSGVPTSVTRTDYSGLKLISVSLAIPVAKGSCDSGAILVIPDEIGPPEVSLSLALTAFASAKKFSCYVTDECSRINGSLATFPKCAYYPAESN